MQELVKKEWTTPTLETLDVKDTMYGKGKTYIDFVTVDDMDITEPS
jgi:hypothetical protein